MNALRRHQLVWLNDAGWQQVRAQASDEQASECIGHWARHRLPLVVARQLAHAPDDGLLALGLPAPTRWGRRRLSLRVAWPGVAYFDEFPRAAEVTRLLTERARPAWLRLCVALDQAGARTRVYGSHGWQHLTGLDHLRPGSDLDLLMVVATPEQADHVAALLAAHDLVRPRPRLDGELVFGNGAAVAWREWAAWRAGRTRQVLVKSGRGAALSRDAFWNAPRHAAQPVLCA